MAAEWTFSDAWVLTAIAMVRTAEGAALSEVIAAADGVNHAILLHGEVEQAIRRLLGAGLLVDGESLRLSAEGEAVTAPVQGGMWAQLQGAQNRLGRIPVVEADWTLDPVRFRAAVDAYLHPGKKR